MVVRSFCSRLQCCKMWCVVVVFLCNLSVLASGKLNYCGARMCKHTDAHTFCQFSGGRGPQCIGYVDTTLSTEEKIRLVIRLNQRRAAVAKGKLRGFPTAGNMMKLLWIEELAREAQLWADQCEPPSTPEENDACRDLYSVAVGQCVASVIGEAPGLRPESMVDIWYMQNMFYRGNITSFDPPINIRYNYYGDFAQLVYSKTYMVGCGRSRFMVSMSGRLRSVERLVCNFAPRGPSAGRPLWTVASPGSACPPRSLPDDNVPALCVVKRELDETHDQDNLMSLEEHILLETVFEVDKNESLNYLGSIDEIFLTKVAVATISDVVTTPMDYNSMQRRGLVDANNETIIGGENKNAVQYQTIEENIRTEAFQAMTKVVLVGRPKSYNIEELNEDDYESKEDDDNTDTEIRDLPIKEKHFDVDYEFKEGNEERKAATIEEPVVYTSTVSSTVHSSVIAFTGYVTEYTEYQSISPITLSTEEATIQTTIMEDTTMNESTIGVTTNIDMEFINNLKEYITHISGGNSTDALLEEYLSDPDTVRRLQEELDRLEEAMSTVSSTAQTQAQTQVLAVERADKVRRALNDGSEYPAQQLSNHPQIQERAYSDNSTFNIAQMLQGAYPDNSTFSVPQMLRMFSENDDRNKSMNPMLSMAMRYIPYLKDYKPGIMQTLSRSNRNTTTYIHLVVMLLLTNVL